MAAIATCACRLFLTAALERRPVCAGGTMRLRSTANGTPDMPISDGADMFHGSVPEIYERFLVPLIFQPYADDLAARVAVFASRRVLEIAAGTGVATRALA